jgi:hypothetical protein
MGYESVSVLVLAVFIMVLIGGGFYYWYLALFPSRYKTKSWKKSGYFIDFAAQNIAAGTPFYQKTAKPT